MSVPEGYRDASGISQQRILQYFIVSKILQLCTRATRQEAPPPVLPNWEQYRTLGVNGLNTRGHSCKLIKQHCTMDATKFYFSNRIVSILNCMFEDVVSAPSVTALK